MKHVAEVLTTKRDIHTLGDSTAPARRGHWGVRGSTLDTMECTMKTYIYV